MVALALSGCPSRDAEDAVAMVGGDALTGERLMNEYACLGCHTMAGHRSGTRSAGVHAPPLDELLSRVYILDSVPNTPDNLVAFIRDPEHVAPGTRMPWVGATVSDARDIASYLYSTSR
jgi:cytochrome c2